MSEYAIQINNLVKKFDELIAVNDVTLRIKKGEIFGLLGPNGAGKTTAINLILGLLKPTSGKILVNDLDIDKHAEEVHQLIGMMTQETVVESDLTAHENLEIFAELYHVPHEEIPGRIKEALLESDLTNFANKKAGTFSGGMKRRLELVKSMIQRPKILILDEPTTGLDIQNRKSMWEHIKELNRDGVTIILTTQYLEEADVLCDKLAIIDHGKIKATGTPSELKKMVGGGRVLELVFDNNSEATAASAILKSVFKITATVKAEQLTAAMDSENTDMVPKILTELDKRKITVSSVNLHMPTLDDVFVKLTGSAMRDATGEMKGSRSEMMRGMSRGRG